MTDHDPRPLGLPASEPTPEEELEVTRLLAEAAGPEPMPQPVADRLDAVLAGLVAEWDESSAPVSQLPLRRRWPRMALAAAAVVVAGVAVGSVVNEAGVSPGADDASSGGQSSAESASAPPGGGVAGDEAAGRATEPGTDEPPSPQLLALGPVTLHGDRLERDVRRLLTGRPVRSAVPREMPEGHGPCRPRSLTDGQRWVPATYDGRPAVLVTGPEQRDAVEASVHDCAGAVLASVRVPLE
jgi:hypothetical protein